MQGIRLFEHEQFGQVRVHLDEDGNPWWVAADVCRVLDLSNPTMALNTLDDDEKLTLSNIEGQTGHGGAQFFNIINEPGLYSLILRSRKPEAKEFKRWLTHEVLPAIRKTGRYEHTDITVLGLENKKLLATGLLALADSDLYPKVRATLFRAEAVSVLSGEPMTKYLPPVAAGRELWLTPTELEELTGLTANMVGRILKKLGLHGKTDLEHKHSEPYWNKAQHSVRQVISYKYDPDVIVPAIKEYLEGTNEKLSLV
jgi:prophage antirepressor-like protein